MTAHKSWKIWSHRQLNSFESILSRCLSWSKSLPGSSVWESAAGLCLSLQEGPNESGRFQGLPGAVSVVYLPAEGAPWQDGMFWWQRRLLTQQRGVYLVYACVCHVHAWVGCSCTNAKGGSLVLWLGTPPYRFKPGSLTKLGARLMVCKRYPSFRLCPLQG